MKDFEIATQYFSRLSGLFEQVEDGAISGVLKRLREARDGASRVYIAGNGGSASTASHWANDLGKATKRSGCVPFQVMCLSDNTSWLTALANDEGYERVFAGQLENFARPGDVLVVISASGNSPNLVRAVEMARSRGMSTIGFLGFDGGALKDMVDDLLWIKTEKGRYELVEDAHMVLCHVLTSCLIADKPALREQFAAKQ
jgi:D-sedoheptulose 7-phosphate isomerase